MKTLPLLLCLMVSGCSIELDRADVPCQSSAQCSSGLVCDLSIQRCVAEQDGRPSDASRNDHGEADSAVQDATIDASADGDPGSRCSPGLCKACGDDDEPYMPVDDPACGVIDCDGKDNFTIDGAGSATGTNYRVRNDYHDLSSGRCKALGQCKEPDSADCDDVTSSRVDTCAECKQATKSGCSTYADYTSCGGENRCYDGYCATACSTHDDGTQPCSVLCSWCSGVCRGARTDAGQNVSCSHDGEPMWCFCTF